MMQRFLAYLHGIPETPTESFTVIPVSTPT